MIKSRGGAALFVFTLALLVLLYNTLSADAHEFDSHAADSITAGNVDVTKESDVRAFLEHAAAHWRDASNSVPHVPPVLEFRAKMREEGGEWKKETLYLIRLSGGGDSIVLHPFYPLGQGAFINDEQAVAQRIAEEAVENPEEVRCGSYLLDGVNRWGCAVQIYTSYLRSEQMFMAGLHHGFEDLSFAKQECPYYVPKTSALDVVDEETLKAFVDEAADYYLDLNRTRGGTGVLATRNCRRVLPWKYGSIYLFRLSLEGRVIFNASTPELEEHTWVFVKDKTGTDVAKLILDAVGELKSGEGVFLDYYWDDPTTPDDDVDIEKCPEGPRTCSPGTSLKRTYVKKVSLKTASGTHDLIVGSGIYPKEEESGDGDGCAIAGAGHKIQGVLVNLFLMVSILFSAVWAGNRYRKRRTVSGKEGAGRRMFTSLFAGALALLVLFSWGESAVAQEGTTTAGSVSETDEGDMKDFVLHAKARWEAIETPSENIDFERSLTTEGSDWNSGTIYLMAITDEGSILVHGEDPRAQNGTLIHYGPPDEDGNREGFLHEEIQALIDAAGAEEGGCVRYGHDMRVACAVKFKHPIWNADGESSLILIGGYHHDHEENADTEITFAGIECPYFAEVRNESPFFFQGISANEVVDNESLKEFVE